MLVFFPSLAPTIRLLEKLPAEAAAVEQWIVRDFVSEKKQIGKLFFGLKLFLLSFCFSLYAGCFYLNLFEPYSTFFHWKSAWL